MVASPRPFRHGLFGVAFVAGGLLISACGAPCEARGGRLNAGLSGKGTCVQRTRDGGRVCHDKRECEFDCFAPEQTLRGALTDAGRCAEWPIRFGCHNAVEDGVATGTICID